MCYLGPGDDGSPGPQVLTPPVGPGDVHLQVAVLFFHRSDLLLQLNHNLTHTHTHIRVKPGSMGPIVAALAPPGTCFGLLQMGGAEVQVSWKRLSQTMLDVAWPVETVLGLSQAGDQHARSLPPLLLSLMVDPCFYTF